MEKIIDILDQLVATFHHVVREANYEVDSLAREGVHRVFISFVV